MRERERLPGGNTGGAIRVGDTVRRVPGVWTASVYALLGHLETVCSLGPGLGGQAASSCRAAPTIRVRSG